MASPDPEPFRQAVQAALESVRPALRADGGDVELVSTDAELGRVELRLVGACRHCPASSMTLTYAVEARLRQQVPAIRDIAAV